MSSDEANVENNSDNDEEMEKDEADSVDSGEDDENEKLENEAKELENVLAQNVYSYDTHVALVEVYRKLIDLTAMRASYERFSETYPLTDKLWLAWIKDEITVASSDKEESYVISLLEKAVEDYLSIDLWLQYVQYTMSLNNTDLTRRTFEKALGGPAGLHMIKSSLLWDAYRDFELAHLSLQPDPTSELWEQQAKRVADVFRRQLRIPLVDMERTFIEWRVWLEKLPRKGLFDAAEVEQSYKKARRTMEDCEEYEERLLAAVGEEDRLQAYAAYIKSEPQPSLKVCLYERAVAELSLSAGLWLEYCSFVVKLKGQEELALKVVERALRNCPWSVALWVTQMRVLELFEDPAKPATDQVTQCFEKAISNGFATPYEYLQLWLAYIENCKRHTTPSDEQSAERLRSVFNKACEHLAQTFGLQGDPDCTLLRLWARLEASFLGDLPAARRLWTDILTQGQDSQASAWLELIELERYHGDEKHLRRAFQRALGAAKDWPETIVQAWIGYERQSGTLETLMDCLDRCQEFMKSRPAVQEVVQQEKPSEKRSPAKKRKFEQINDKAKNKKEVPAKKAKPADSAESSKPNNTQPEETPQDQSDQKYKKIEMEPGKVSRTIFVSNLDYAVTEEQLRAFLEPVDELRLVTDAKGNSKGFGYAVFATAELAEKAISRDRERLGDRPVFISRCDPDKASRIHQFKYATTAEKHKLFVRGLPLAATQQEIEEVFRPHGDLKEVRMVSYRNGHFKGLAYVEFASEKDAAKAVLATDNTLVQGQTISVAISAPPDRRQQPKKDGGAVQQQAVPRHSKSRLQVPLLPRAVTTEARQTKPSMTNSDFRQMLLGNKK